MKICRRNKAQSTHTDTIRCYGTKSHQDGTHTHTSILHLVDNNLVYQSFFLCFSRSCWLNTNARTSTYTRCACWWCGWRECLTKIRYPCILRKWLTKRHAYAHTWKHLYTRITCAHSRMSSLLNDNFVENEAYLYYNMLV